MHYDRTTMAFHWLTAALVVLLFGSWWWWSGLVHGTPLRKTLQATHVSLGILFAAVVLCRLVWRQGGGRRLPRVMSGAMGRLASAVHTLLYLLLALQLMLGFAYRWAQGEEFSFFGLLQVPEVLGPSSYWKHIFGPMHYYSAWAIVLLAGCHATAALIHHYILRDRVLARMVPMR